MPSDVSDKAATAFRTIGEVSRDTGLPQHILRYWETRFVQLRPVQRAGNRRYYRPEDMALVRRIDHLLNRDGYTVRGVQQLLATEGTQSRPATIMPAAPPSPADSPAGPIAAIRSIRHSLQQALTEDDASVLH